MTCIPLQFSELGPETAWIYPLFRTILNSILRGHRGIISGLKVSTYHPCRDMRFKAFLAYLQGFREGGLVCSGLTRVWEAYVRAYPRHLCALLPSVGISW